MAKRFTVMRKQAEVLERLEDVLNEIIRDKSMTWDVVGKEEEQARHWKTYELLWEDEEHTIPKYKNKYDYVPKAELDEDDQITIDVCNGFLKKLDKLI